MIIGQAAKLSGLSVKAVRYYESVGLITATRRSNGYREYSNETLRQLVFLQRARSIGFALSESRVLLSLLDSGHQHNFEVEEKVNDKIAQIDRQISELQQMRNSLELLSSRYAVNKSTEYQRSTDIPHSVQAMPFTLVDDPI